MEWSGWPGIGVGHPWLPHCCWMVPTLLVPCRTAGTAVGMGNCGAERALLPSPFHPHKGWPRAGVSLPPTELWTASAHHSHVSLPVPALQPSSRPFRSSLCFSSAFSMWQQGDPKSLPCSAPFPSSPPPRDQARFLRPHPRISDWDPVHRPTPPPLCQPSSSQG